MDLREWDKRLTMAMYCNNPNCPKQGQQEPDAIEPLQCERCGTEFVLTRITNQSPTKLGADNSIGEFINMFLPPITQQELEEESEKERTRSINLQI